MTPRSAGRPASCRTPGTSAPLPYGEWAHEFRGNLPQEIADYTDSVIAGTKGVDNSESIMERLKTYMKLFRLSRYSLNGGSLRAGERVSGGRQSGESTTPKRTVEREPGARRPGSETGDLLASMFAADGDEATALPPAEPLIPQLVWLSGSGGASIPDLMSKGNELIVAVVREWFQQALVETVLGAQALQGERRWSPKDMETILSPRR